MGYVRCGLASDYGHHKDGRPAHYLTPSTRSFNSLYGAQKDPLRRYARAHGLRLARVYCDLEDPGAIDLLERTGLVGLLAETGRHGATTVLVEAEVRLCDDPLVAGFILRHFHYRGIEVVDVTRGVRLTSKLCAKKRLEGRAADEISRALRLFRRLKGVVTRTRNRTSVGRKSFGERGDEGRCLERLRSLCARLPRDEWRQRKGFMQTRRSFRQIADILNAEGFATRQGNPWAAGTVRGIVRREWPGLRGAWSRPSDTPAPLP